jgi:lipoprotein-anchoring transpeptidase ErfK/SrfK
VAAAALLLFLASAAQANPGPVVWTSPTQATATRFSVREGAHLAFVLRASTTIAGGSVRIRPEQRLPLGAELSSSAGTVARANFRWVPAQAGDYRIQFVAVGDRGGSAPRLTYLIHVDAVAYVLTDANVGHWAVVVKPAVVRAEPNGSAAAVSRLETTTTDGTQNVVLVLAGLDPGPTQSWYRIRLPILPNNSTGWVPGNALGDLHTVHTHLYVDRTKLIATLKRDGRTVFSTIVGVGRPYWPTPRGEFYVRDKLTGFDDPFYGPVAFGTSARSAVLTDWPGGGFVGIHGTDEPEVLPGHVSHGCIRLRNQAILKLSRLMQVGTPVTIR